jgi:restriction system protein
LSFEAIFKGWTGELKTKATQFVFLNSNKYHTLNNVLVTTLDDSTQTDHVIVSQFGIFVVETKDKGHWIYGGERDSQWTQVIFNEKFRFQNPLRQNYKHIKSLSELLKIDEHLFHSLIVFWGGCKFKTEMPSNVVNSLLGFIKYIKSKKEILLSEDQVIAVLDCLATIKENTTSSQHREHVKALKEKHCPQCGGLLVERTAKSGVNSGKKFLGCSRFPKCRYMRPINTDN